MMLKHRIYKALGFLPVFFTLGLFAWSFSAYYTHVAPLIHERSAVLGVLWTGGISALLLLALWSYAVCVARNPGNPPLRSRTVFSHGGGNSMPAIRVASTSANDSSVRHRSGSDSDASDDDTTALTSEQLLQTQLIHTITVKDNGEPRFCLKCNVPKPDRAHHCSTCNVCVLKMDHHCPWLNNCVGFRTQKAFVLFLIYTAIYALVVFVATLVYYALHALDLPGDELIALSPVFMMLLAAAFSLCLFGFGGFHVYLMLTNTTTLESYEGNKFRRVQKKNLNLFDLGCAKNFKQVFGHHWPHWFLPTHTSLGDGIRYPINFESYNMAMQ
ncbi:palmitoyltransferase for Vac8p [Coemansia sp. RSA 2706]|nr:palmitoyltransferase for Vac8p [Coemansia sp. RSA 2706]KAJ2315548.1 palmitoyltransferase for Vac8p [Coemansia sp. RSA 2705]KAJ2320202.1 palmitoyltransferase for Vac8p [Coemansia sp. RSA 2704]KAJ2738088.1 palmitoyltransferase for Vac8p [Coemansia sp. Cherry 401B]